MAIVDGPLKIALVLVDGFGLYGSDSPRFGQRSTAYRSADNAGRAFGTVGRIEMQRFARLTAGGWKVDLVSCTRANVPCDERGIRNTARRQRGGDSGCVVK